MHSNPDPAYLLGQTGLASFSGPWVRCDYLHRVSFTVSWTAVAATAGTLSLEGTDYPIDRPELGAVPATAIVPLTITAFHGTWPAVAAIAAVGLVIAENLPRWVRLTYTRSAGGGAAQFDIRRGGYFA